ncbi:MAG TPA: phosphatase PAP2 family protein [Thermomicrobiales bacterium]|nr:phosphatase PAP2 family protein [Thermomicrobiales bacterium]
MSTRSSQSARVSRRLLVGSSLAGAALLPLGSGRRASARPAGATVPALSRRQETVASPAGWRTWYLTSPDELRPATPGAPTQTEIDELLALQADRTTESSAVAARWGTGSALFPWSNMAGALCDEFGIVGMPQGRFMAHLHTALHDAAVAAWDAQVAYARPSPGATSEEITPLAGVDPSRPSFPSEHAAAAGAAAVVLAALLPDAASGRFDALATEAAESRLAAGAAFRSDIAAGLVLGRAIGERATARTKSDGSAERWDPATMPAGPGIWKPTPSGFVETPVAPLAGSWQPWVMTSGDQFRPAPPPEYGSPAWQAELTTVQEIAANRSFEQSRAAAWWGDGSPFGFVNDWIHELVAKEDVDLPHAARILADAHVAIADTAIAVWDAKYTWWTSRPITEDPTLQTVIPTPPYPAYPSGYSAFMGAGTTVIGRYFPDVADEMADRAWEAAASRAWAGIHYVIDDDTGLAMGRRIGRLVCALPGTTA